MCNTLYNKCDTGLHPMDMKSHLYLSTAERCVTSESFTDVISSTLSHGNVTVSTGYDVTVSRNYEFWDAVETSATQYNIERCGACTSLDSSQRSFTDTRALCNAITTVADEPPRCLDNANDVTSSWATSQELTQLSVCSKQESVDCNSDDDVSRQEFPGAITYSDVIRGGDGDRCHDNVTSSETTPTQRLRSSEDVETYFSTDGRPWSIETSTQRHHHHQHHSPHDRHVYHEHQQPDEHSQQQVLTERASSSSSPMSDVKQLFYPYSADHQHLVQLHQSCLVTATNYHQSTAGRMSLTAQSHSSMSETANSSGSMLYYSPSTTSSSHHGAAGTDGDMTGSFSALLQSSPITHHFELGLSTTSAHYGSIADLGVENGDSRCVSDAAAMTDSTLLSFYNLMQQPSYCYGDDQMTAWSSAAITSLMSSFADSATDYPSTFITVILHAH